MYSYNCCCSFNFLFNCHLFIYIIIWNIFVFLKLIYIYIKEVQLFRYIIHICYEPYTETI